MQCVQLSVAFYSQFLRLLECRSVSEHIWETFHSLGVTGHGGAVRWSQAAHLQLLSKETNSFCLINIMRFSVMTKFKSDN